MKPRVLIVDDSSTVRMDLKGALEDAHIAAFWSGSVAAARKALGMVAFDAVLLDVVLPDGDGIDLLREIKTVPATADVPVIMLSAEADVARRVRALGFGADEYLGKPYDRGQVVARVRALWRRRLPAARAKALVLVVDDSASSRSRIGAALELAGCEVAEAADGAEGLRTAAALRPDAIVLDQIMPGLTGLGFLRALRADPAMMRVPCLLLTASDDPEAEPRALAAGADAFLPKDGDMDLVVARLKQLLPAVPAAAGGGGPSLMDPRRLLAVDGGRGALGPFLKALRAEGCDVVVAPSAGDAQTLVGVQPVDGVLVDRLLPDLPGDELCRRLRANVELRAVPLLLFTQPGDRRGALAGLDSGADDVVALDEDPGVVSARLKARLRRRRFDEEGRAAREQMFRREMEDLELRTVRELAASRAAHIAELEARNRALSRARDEALALVRSLEEYPGDPYPRAGVRPGPDGVLRERVLAGVRGIGTWIGEILERGPDLRGAG